MTDDDYLKLIQETWQPDCRDHVLFAMVGVAGEAGEVANLAQKGMRGDFTPSRLSQPHTPAQFEKRKQLIEEMGGVFYFLHALCWQLGVEPSEVKKINADKLRSRLARGKIRGDGDER
jgi:NTP pyrophosphatase (non-canonical NTP hydrolase)